MARILVVDDDEQIRKVLELTLIKAGYKVACAANGKIAAALFRRNPFDLLITDILMPEMEGIETIIKLRQLCPGLKVFAMSGGGRLEAEKYLESAAVFGACRVFEKPFDRKLLLQAIKEEL